MSPVSGTSTSSATNFHYSQANTLVKVVLPAPQIRLVRQLRALQVFVIHCIVDISEAYFYQPCLFLVYRMFHMYASLSSYYFIIAFIYISAT